MTQYIINQVIIYTASIY